MILTEQHDPAIALIGNTQVTLDGTKSSDPDNNLPLSYEWSAQSAPSGSTVTLSSTSAAKPTFMPDKAGDYVIALTVTDSLGMKSTTADTVKITAKVVGSTPTTFSLSAASQSVNPNAVVRLYGTLRTGAIGLPGQPVELWVKAGSGAWFKAGSWTTGTGGLRSWDVWSAGHVAQTYQYYFFFASTSTYAAAKSNVITIKYETTKTTPYQTALYAYAPKPVTPKGTLNQMWVKLQSGNAPLTGQYVFVWKWSGGTFVIVSRVITRTASQSPGAGWALADYRWNSAGTGMYKFTYFGTSPARSESNAVLLRWT